VDAYPILLYGCISYLFYAILACQLSYTETSIQKPFLLAEALNIYSNFTELQVETVYVKDVRLVAWALETVTSVDLNLLTLTMAMNH